jgi:pyridoxal phosphate enzyme (YggS family)
MHKNLTNLTIIEKQINDKIEGTLSDSKKINIIAISKTFKMIDIKPLIDHGHIHFGENKVQEAVEKWSEIKSNPTNLKLHMVGKLQTNKVKFILPLFDYIHSLDNLKLAEKISIEQERKKFHPKIFIQVNIGKESQKSGIEVENLEIFFKTCVNKLNLNIIGLMCIPPNDEHTDLYFKEMNELNKKLGLKDLSMGMSSDYEIAIKNKATFIRIGSKIFGDRSK